MICCNCKKSLPENAKFCRYCGIATNNSISANKTFDNILEKTPYPSKASNVSILGHIGICFVVLIIAVSLYYYYTETTTSFNELSLKNYTYAGKDTKISLTLPFKLNDERVDETGSSIDKITYRIGTSTNYKVELISLKYKNYVTNVSDSDVMDFFLSEISNNKDCSDILKDTRANKIIDGQNCIQQSIVFYDKQAKCKLKTEFLVFIKKQEYWIISFTFKAKNSDANIFSDKLINSIKIE